MKKLLFAAALALLGTPALAQKSPNWTYKYVPTTAEWNNWFAKKQDTLGYVPLNTAGGVMTGRLVTAAPSATTSGLNLTPGSVPANPADGDLWITPSGLYARVNGATVGPFVGAGTSTFLAAAPLTVTFGAGTVTYGISYGPSLTLSAGSLVLNPANGNTFTAAQAINLNAAALPIAQSGTVLQLQQIDGATTRLEVDAIAATTSFSGTRTNGTRATPSALAANDEISGFTAWGYNGTSIVGPVSAVRQYAAEAFSIGHQGSYLRVSTTPIGSTTLTDVVGFEHDGGVTAPPSVTGGSKGVGSINIGGALYSSGVAPTGSGAYVRAASPTVANLTVTGTFTASGLVTNTDLANPSMTINGTVCTLGGSCAPTATAASITVGTTAVNSGTSLGLLYDNAGALGNTNAANNAVLVTSGVGAPSLSTTLPSGLSIPSPLISSASLTAPAIGAGGLTVAGATTGATTIVAAASASGTLTLPAVTAVLVGDTAAQTLSNKTLASPVLTGTVSGAGTIPNSVLVNSSITVNGSTCTLGSSCTPASTFAVGSSIVTGGANGYIFYDNAGVLGNLATTGTGNAVLQSSPTINTLTVTTAFNATGLVTAADLFATTGATGSVVLSTSPTIASPTITGTATISAILGGTAAGSTVSIQSTSNGTPSGDSISLKASAINLVTATGAGSTTVNIGAAASSSGVLAIAGATSGATTIQASAAAGGTLTLPPVTDTLAGKALANGGTGTSLTASPGGIVYSGASSLAILAGTATANLPLISGPNAAPSWAAFTLPALVTSGGIPYFSSASAMGSSGVLAANALVLGGGPGIAPATMASLGTGSTVLHGNASGTPIWGAVSLTADVSGVLPLANGGTNSALTASNGGIVYSDGASLQILAGTATAGLCVLSNVNAAPSWGSCSGAAAVSSVANSDGTLTVSPTTGSVVASLNTGHANTWTAAQTFNSTMLRVLGSSTGYTAFSSTNSSASNYSVTLPAYSGTLAMIDVADQVLTGGANVSPKALTSGNITVDCGQSPLQWVVNTGAFTLTAPNADGSCILLVVNGPGAGTITPSGFFNGTNTGDIYSTAVRGTATATISIASPGVIAWNSHGLPNNWPVYFTTTGSLPSGLATGTIYYTANVSTNTFNVSATPGGPAISTSGSQSGTQTATAASQFSFQIWRTNATPRFSIAAHQ